MPDVAPTFGLSEVVPMRKIAFALVLSAAALICGHRADAAGYWMNGILFGNVCRNGVYWQLVPYEQVGSACYMPSWNLPGEVATE